jgi:hypothetical protein
MTKLLEKEAKFKWSPQCKEAFLTLKELLTTAPVLAQLDIENPFDVYCDGIRHGYWGSVDARWLCNCLCFMTASTP